MEETKKYYLCLFDYGNGQALFETDFVDTEEQALQLIDNFSFYIYNYQLRLDLMCGKFFNNELEDTFLVRNLEIGR